MCVFIDFARLAAALRCCRNVVSIGRHGMLRLAVGTAILLAAACLVAQEAAAQASDAEIARAVRTVRNTEGLGLMRPSISAAMTIDGRRALTRRQRAAVFSAEEDRGTPT